MMLKKLYLFLIAVLSALMLFMLIGCGDDENPTGPVTTYVTDIDGNKYKTIQIGDQVWMAENLKVTHYRNGYPIPKVTDPAQWRFLTDGAYCEYENDSTNVAVYGRLYNWYVINNTSGLAPEGWHVPTNADWEQLEMSLGMSQESADSSGFRGDDEGGKLKVSDTLYWHSPNEGATNSSGFSALPAGYRIYSDYYQSIEYTTYFWTASQDGLHAAMVRALHHYEARIFRGGNYLKTNGLSIRCVKD